MNDRRHELEKNELAVRLDQINKTIEPYSRWIAIAVGLLVVVAIGFLFYTTKNSEVRSDATLGLLQASASGDPEVMGQISESYPETLAGNWARVFQGNEFLGQGIRSLYNDRENAVQLLSDARNSFSNALVGQSDPLLQSRVHFGLARVAESMGELDEAITHYERTIAVAESEAMIDKAQERIDSLNSASTKQFLTWFAEQDFSPAEPSLPPSLPGVDMLPDGPIMDLDPLELGNALGQPSGDSSDPTSTESSFDLPEDPQPESIDPQPESIDAEPTSDVVPPADDNAADADNSRSEDAAEEVENTVGGTLDDLEGDADPTIQLDDAGEVFDPEPTRQP